MIRWTPKKGKNTMEYFWSQHHQDKSEVLGRSSRANKSIDFVVTWVGTVHDVQSTRWVKSSDGGCCWSLVSCNWLWGIECLCCSYWSWVSWLLLLSIRNFNWSEWDVSMVVKCLSFSVCWSTIAFNCQVWIVNDIKSLVDGCSGILS